MMLGGSVLFLVAAIMMTFVANVPISYAIDQLEPSGSEPGERWADLYTQWSWCNHVRSLGSIAAAAALAGAALRTNGRPEGAINRTERGTSTAFTCSYRIDVHQYASLRRPKAAAEGTQ